MLSGWYKYIYAASSLSFLYLMVWTIEFSKTLDFEKSSIWLHLFIFSVIVSRIIIKKSGKKLEVMNLKIKSIKNVENRIFWNNIFYLILPLFVYAYYEYTIMVVVILVLYIFILTTGLYYYNPTIYIMFGYNYYKIEIEGDNRINNFYILISKSITRKVDANVYEKWWGGNTGKTSFNAQVVQIFDHLLMEVDVDCPTVN